MTDWTAFDRQLASRRRAIVEGLVEFVRLNSVSQESAKVRVTAEWLTDVLRARGLAGRLFETRGNPLVFGERRVPGATRTVLIYCHYDTKPIPPAGWLQPDPLEPVFRRGLPEEGGPGRPLGDFADDDLGSLSLYARGAADDKGPIWSHLHALELMDALGRSPTANVKFIFDGEEEIDSPSLGPFAEAHRDLHSGNFVAPNPAWKLNGLLASMATSDGVPLIEAFEEDVVGPTAAERQMMAALPLDLPALEKDLGVGLPADYVERIMFHPTLTINGLQSGFVGAEANTIIPHRATVALDIRMVKNQQWRKVYGRLLEHLRAQGFTVLESADEPLPDDLRGQAVRVVEKSGYDAAKTSLELPISREIIAAVERAHGDERAVLLPTMGGTVPMWVFTDVLKLPTLVVPYANQNNRQHGPNEHMKLDHLFQGIRTTAQLLTDLAAPAPTA